MKFWVVVILINLFALVSCKRNDKCSHCPNSCSSETIFLNSEISKFKFLKNTFWVYTDSVSFSTDSVFIDSILSNGMFPSSTCSARLLQIYAFRTSPTNTSTGIKDVYVLSANDMIKDATKENDFSRSIYSSHVPNGISTMIDSIFIFDRYYKHVEITTVLSDGRESGAKTSYYVNSDFGILRKDVFNSNGTLKSKKLLMRKNILR